MSRDLTVNMQTAVQQGVIRPVLIGRFDILSDPLTAWTGPGTFVPSGTADAALNGQTFFHFAPFMEISDIVEDRSIGGPAIITVSGHDLDEDLLRQIVRDKREWRGRPAYLWMGLLNADEATVIPDPVRIKTGVMTSMKTSRDGEKAIIEVTIDRDLGNAKSAPFRWVDHARIYPDDDWSKFIVKIASTGPGLTNFAPGNIRDLDPGDRPPEQTR